MYKFKTNEGTNAGLRLWIAFMIGLWLVGIRPAGLCIVLGAIGGFAVGWLVSRWGAEQVAAKPSPPPEATPSQPASSGQLRRIFSPAEQLRLGERWRNLGLFRPRLRLPRRPERKPPKQL
jgi:hypothetical protein